MRYVKLVGLWLAGLVIPVFIGWVTANAGWDAVPKIMGSCIAGYLLLGLTSGFMKLLLNANLDQIGGWTFGMNLVALSLGNTGPYFAIGTSIGILVGWYLLEQSKEIWQRQPA